MKNNALQLQQLGDLVNNVLNTALLLSQKSLSSVTYNVLSITAFNTHCHKYTFHSVNLSDPPQTLAVHRIIAVSLTVDLSDADQLKTSLSLFQLFQKLILLILTYSCVTDKADDL